MSERGAGDAMNAPTLSGGALLRQARMTQGIHIAALAAQIKVTPRKLELLETERYDELPDLAFARGLAQTVCRALKIDPEPVLARLPQPKAQRLEHATRGLDTPFRQGAGRPADEAPLLRPVVWGPALILIAALALYLVPQRWMPRDATVTSNVEPAAAPKPAVAIAPSISPAPAGPSTTQASAAAPPAAPKAEPPAVVETVHSAPPAEAAASPPSATSLVLRTSGAASWVEVIDARGRALLSRTVQAGETVGLDGTPPLKLRIGNASAMQLTYRCKPIDLKDFTREHNIARLELK